MSETAVITLAPPSEEWTAAPEANIRPLYAVALALALCLGGLSWLYYQGAIALSPPPARVHGSVAAVTRTTSAVLLSTYDSFVFRLTLVTAGGGAFVIAALAAGLVLSRRGWARRWDVREEQWRSKEAGLQFQLAERQRLEADWAEAEARARAHEAELERRIAVLQSDLDLRRRSEHSLSQQRQVLESSKTVLELHVQARTREVQELKHRYELILNSAGEGICGLDPHGKVTFVNPAVGGITGWSLEEIIGKTLREVFCQGNGESQAEPADGGSGEQVFYRKDGGRFEVEFVRTRIQEDGRQTGSVLIFKDITERRRSEEALTQKVAELARSNAELEQFAFVASHDLQEPLRKIQAFGDRLKVKCDGVLPVEAKDYLERMQGASARMRTLINDLLAFSRVIRSSEPFVAVDLGRVAREVLGDLEVRLEKSGGRVDIGELPSIEADATQMRQLLMNLIGNALKFQPPNARPLVKVDARKFATLSGAEYCELTVQDNGIGFEEQYAEKIFVVFQRLHGRDEYEGTGVGLAVCRRIADRHEGTIIAKSQPGQGATFIVTLPVCQNKEKTAS